MKTYPLTLFLLIFLIVHENLTSKYLLAKITESTNDNFRKLGDGEKTNANISLYRQAREYPETAELKGNVMGRCKNKILKAKKSFIVNRVKTGPKSKFNWEFTAVLENLVLSKLSAKSGGICNLVVTYDHSKGCGLATTLMEYCFTDDNVGGIDVQNNEDFKKENFKKWRKMAMQKCDHIVYLQCAANPVDACSAYFTAAINTEHTLMFSITKPVIPDPLQNIPERMTLFNVAKTQPLFKVDPHGWIDTNGSAWYFCKCKTKSCTIL